jgi:uncharacterized protein (DUF1697 family)
MTPHVALLRGVNVGGHNRVAMADLRGLLARLGLRDARSLLQSGNLVFGSGGRTAAQLERLLEEESRKSLSLDVDYFVRTAREWAKIVASNPFAEAARRDPAHLVLLVLKQAPAAPRVEALRAAITGPEVLHFSGREAYVVYPEDIGHSRLTTTLVERTLCTRVTARNWSTVLKLAALLAPAEA